MLCNIKKPSSMFLTGLAFSLLAIYLEYIRWNNILDLTLVETFITISGKHACYLLSGYFVLTPLIHYARGKSNG